MDQIEAAGLPGPMTLGGITLPLVGRARVYACGITPYDVTHVGHAAAFVWVDTLARVGRLGRALGVHLLLAAQRLDEGRLRGLKSHLRYRLVMRTFSAGESVAALGTPAAFELHRRQSEVEHDAVHRLELQFRQVAEVALHERESLPEAGES